MFLNSCLITLAVGSLIGAKPADHPVPIGTFIQWYLVRDWSDAKWQTEFNNLKKVGMSYLVFAPALDSKTREAFYATSVKGARQMPPDQDLVENVLRNAKKNNFRVFLGLNMHDDWWSRELDDLSWLGPQMEEGNAVAQDLYTKYKKRYPKTFYGWYWVWEADNYRFAADLRRKVLAEAIEINAGFLKKLDPSMPIMLCPFMNGLGSVPSTYAKTWEYVFAHTSLGKDDIFCPQDCCGAGGLNLGNVEMWFKALKGAVDTKPGLKFWSDAETFDQRYWSSAPLDRFVKQLALVRPYVGEYLTFAYSHYYSPNAANPAWQKAYAQYVKTGKLPAAKVAAPIVVGARKLGSGKVEIEIVGDRGANGDLGYEVSRGGKVIGIVQIPEKQRTPKTAVSYTDDPAVHEDNPDYKVRAFDVAGNVSEWVQVGLIKGVSPSQQ